MTPFSTGESIFFSFCHLQKQRFKRWLYSFNSLYGYSVFGDILHNIKETILTAMKNKRVFLCVLEITKYIDKHISNFLLFYFNDKSVRYPLVSQFCNSSLHSNFTIVQKGSFEMKIEDVFDFTDRIRK